MDSYEPSTYLAGCPFCDELMQECLCTLDLEDFDSLLKIQSEFLSKFGNLITEIRMHPETYMEVKQQLPDTNRFPNLKTAISPLFGIKVTTRSFIDPGLVLKFSGNQFIGFFSLTKTEEGKRAGM